ncbi:MAG: histidine phosphatase family protein [Candidatus Paceibacterota bacterium]
MDSQDKLIYLIRHGQSEGNVGKLCQSPDEPLTELGEEQARFLAERFRSIPTDVVLASSMKRARDTAQRVSESTGAPLVVSDLFVELLHKEEFCGLPESDERVAGGDQVWFENADDPQCRSTFTESFSEFKERGRMAIECILDRPEENIAVASHGTFLKMLFAHMLACNQDVQIDGKLFNALFRLLGTGNTSITQCRYTKERGWRLLSWNDKAHLG